MKYVDFSIQTLCVLAALAILCFASNQSDLMLGIFAVQIYLGICQMFSSVASFVRKGPMHIAKRFHLIPAMVYLVIFFASEIRWHESLLLVVITPWILAIYYYILTWRVTFSGRRRNGSFLPHLSF